MKNTKLTLILAGVLAVAPAILSANNKVQPEKPLAEKVRHELVMLPYYNVFDNLQYQVNGNEVTLSGQVTRPVLKSDAENVVKHIAGVAAVHNNIEVLPLSPMDDQIRRAEFRSIYSKAPLSRYGYGPVPPIHIIVRNGNVTLTGFVNNEMDRNIANIAANQVAGVFSVTNNLQVDNKIG
jgi:hyperosmotically inducible protein